MLPKRNYASRISVHCQDGLQILTMENNLVRLSILVSLGATIYEFLDKKTDIDFMFRTRQGLTGAASRLLTVQNPQGGFWDVWPGGWLEMFPNSGRSCEYAGANLGQHGEVFYQPWTYAVIQDDPNSVSVRFSVLSARLPFQLSRTMTLWNDIGAVFLEEEITNCTGQPLSYVWGHHITLGDTFLNEHCRLALSESVLSNKEAFAHPMSRIVPGTSGTIKSMPGKNGKAVDLTRLPPAALGTGDMLFAKISQEGWFTVTDEQKQLGFSACWDTQMFPYAWLWEEFCGLQDYPFFGDTYALSVEPQVSDVPTLQASVEKNKAKVLKSGEIQKTWLTASVYHTTSPLIRTAPRAKRPYFA